MNYKNAVLNGLESGKNLYELHKNNSGKGIKKVSWKHDISVEKINEIMSSESYRAVNLQKLKNRFYPMLIAIIVIIIGSLPLLFITSDDNIRWLVYPLSAS
jgi:hypothetical protein